MVGDLCQVKLFIEGFLIKCFNIEQYLIEVQAMCIDLSMYEGIKDKCIVRAGGVSKGNRLHLFPLFILVILYCLVKCIGAQI